tara:strand:+ start:100 stop:687 length:588 start_codon:yes stop_codon:yes gene_type:complete
LAKKTLIRNPGDTQPFNNLEVHILTTLENLLKGEQFSTETDEDMFELFEIKKIYGLSKKESMYVASLYQYNWDIVNEISSTSRNKMDWSSIEEVVVPEMKLYEVEYYQDVSAVRVISFDVWGGESDMAEGGASADFYVGKSHFSTMKVGEIEIGEDLNVYDSDINIHWNPQHVDDSLLENKNIIKKVLNEYRRKI